MFISCKKTSGIIRTGWKIVCNLWSLIDAFGKISVKLTVARPFNFQKLPQIPHKTIYYVFLFVVFTLMKKINIANKSIYSFLFCKNKIKKWRTLCTFLLKMSTVYNRISKLIKKISRGTHLPSTSILHFQLDIIRNNL